MACLSKWVVIFLVVLGLLVPRLAGRRLMDVKYEERGRIPALRQSLILSALPKGSVPSSTPSKKGHAVVTHEKLITRHLITTDRILRSVPSPGVGH